MMNASAKAVVLACVVIPFVGCATVVSQQRGNKFVYAYADPDCCQCLYVSGLPNYSTYQQLIVERENAEVIEEASMDWDMWRGWLYQAARIPGRMNSGRAKRRVPV